MYLKLLASPDIYAVYINIDGQATYIGTFGVRDKYWNGIPDPV